MATRSAGILLFRIAVLEVLLVHPGGPFWARRDAGAWSIPKGVCEEGEDTRACALREFEEELGAPLRGGELLELGSVSQRNRKVVTAWAVQGDFDPATLRSNTFAMEWPPKSGRRQEFPEVDRAEWFAIETARVKLIDAQTVFLDRLLERL